MDPRLMALASPRSPQGPGAGPLSPAPAPTPGPSSDAPAALGEIAMAFLQAQDPRDAANLLLEFLEQAGVERSKPKKTESKPAPR